MLVLRTVLNAVFASTSTRDGQGRSSAAPCGAARTRACAPAWRTAGDLAGRQDRAHTAGPDRGPARVPPDIDRITTPAAWGEGSRTFLNTTPSLLLGQPDRRRRPRIRMYGTLERRPAGRARGRGAIDNRQSAGRTSIVIAGSAGAPAGIRGRARRAPGARIVMRGLRTVLNASSGP
jgi:hypothetical protein